MYTMHGVCARFFLTVQCGHVFGTCSLKSSEVMFLVLVLSIATLTSTVRYRSVSEEQLFTYQTEVTSLY